MLWQVSLFTGCWKIWLEKNNKVFNSKRRCFSVSEVVDSIIWSMSMWASRDKVFNDVSMFNLSWEAYFRWSRGQKSVHHLLWSPISILKLNFGGSFLKDVRDSMGHHLCSYFGLKLVSESNEAEVYVMLVGCHELKS